MKKRFLRRLQERIRDTRVFF